MDADADSKTKSRIIAHMNKDHSASVARYLEFYNRLPSKSAEGATLEDITFDYMIIQSPATRNIIPFDPPLRNWAESRGRLIRMDEDALEGLGRSNLVVTSYRAPYGFHAVVMAATVLTYMFFYRRGNFRPGSLHYDYLLYRVPRFAGFCHAIQPILFPIMFFVHISEAVWLDLYRLGKYNVPRFTRLWWTWMVSIFCEGIGAKIRFDRLVEEMKREKGRGGH